MKVRLGYIAAPLSFDHFTYAHTITFTRYQALSKTEQKKVLYQIIKKNLENFEKTLWYNYHNTISFYRFSHNLVPLATHPEVSFDYIKPFQKKWQALGSIIRDHQFRVDTHPDQFCVLNSTKEEVVKATRKHLYFHYRLFQAMQIEGKMILHVGSKTDGFEKAKQRFLKNFNTLPLAIKNCLILENDDKSFTVEEVLNLCQSLNIPMVLDYHHYLCHHQKELTKELLEAIFHTWDKEVLPPKIHFSSPKSKTDFRSHSDYLEIDGFLRLIRLLKTVNRDVDIMLECKGRDLALFKLTRVLKCLPEFTFINDTTFYV